jgi:hypothetical protein
MALALSGKYYLGCTDIAVVVGLFGFLAAVVFAAQVCLNKVVSPFTLRISSQLHPLRPYASPHRLDTTVAPHSATSSTK